MDRVYKRGGWLRAFGRRLPAVVAASGLSRVVWVGREGEETMVASAMTRRGALAALGAFGLTLTGARLERASPKRSEV